MRAHGPRGVVLALGVALCAPAWAQDDTTEASSEEERDTDEEAVEVAPEEGTSEILVLSERRVAMARNEVIAAARDEGYTKELRRGDRTILRHGSPWRGDIVLFDDGRVAVKRQPVQFRPPFKKETPLAWMSCILVPLCIRPNGQLVSKRRFKGYEASAWEAIAPDVQAWNDAIAELGTDGKLASLPDQLEALWVLGVPLEPDAARLETWEARREAIWRHYDTRTDTEWGDAVRAVVLAFVRGVVQRSEHPYTADEVAAWNARRQSTRPFEVEREPDALPAAP